MILGMPATKLVVGDVEAAARFYEAIGLKLIAHNVGGEGAHKQKQAWLSVSGDMSSHLLVLAQFLELAAPSPPSYPGEAWLTLNVEDADAFIGLVTRAGGSVVRAAENQPDHGVRAAIVSDNEGHIIEIVGPMPG